MRKYETVFISDPDLQDQQRSELFERVRNIIARENGILLDFDEWGNKKLAYEIKKKLRGHYVCMTYGGTGELVTELERNLRLSDNIMKFMTVLLTADITVEELEQEAKEAAKNQQARKEAAEQAKEEEEEETQPEGDDEAPAEPKAQAPPADETPAAVEEGDEASEPVEKTEE